MKIALVHDYLNQYGGAERVLEALMEMFPDAPIFTLLYDKNKTLGRFEGKIIKTSFLDIPFVRKHHRLFLPFMPLAARTINLGGAYDLIISDTAGYGKGVSYNPETTKHISYCHTPLRYAWETKEYVKAKFGRVLGMIGAVAVSPVAWYLRRWDHTVGQKPDIMLANSRFIAGKIKKYYNREARVLYPPIDMSIFYYDNSPRAGNYYLAAGRLIHYKRFDLIIDAFKELKKPLLIVGSGPEERKLKARARGAANIVFIPFINSAEKLRKFYHDAKALVFAHTEDFGLVAAEAQACGVPVIAYAGGGALEIVNEETGVLFQEQTPSGLVKAVRKFDQKQFNRGKISARAMRFSKEKFQSGIAAVKRSLAGV